MTLSVRTASRDAPNHDALVIGEEAWSFAELAAVVEPTIAVLEARWRDAPATLQSPLALVGASDLPTLVVLYALIELGWPVALVHPRFTETERATLYPLIPRTRWLDAREICGFAATVSSQAETFSSLQTASRVSGIVAPAVEPSLDDERCLAILFTSGTTGTPKGVVLSRRAFAAGARASALNLGWRDGDRWLLGLPIAHVGGLSILTRCLLARRTVVIPHDVAEGRRLTPEALRATLDERDVSIVSLVPTQLEWLLASDAAWSAPRALRVVLLGGAAASPRLLERAHERALPVLTTYGFTEACSQVTTQRAGTTNRGELGAGPPIDGAVVDIRDGVICVRGPTLFSGYFPSDARGRRPDAEGWFETDDLGRFDGNGNLHVLGRRSELVITGGENVVPSEVEAVVERCPGVRAACVFGVPDDTWGELVAVAIVPDGALESLASLEADLGRHVSKHLAPHRRPRLARFVDAFEATPAGKLDRGATARLSRPHLRRLP